MVIAGIDEAGYGPLLGPLVVGCCAFEIEPEVVDGVPSSPGDALPCVWKRLRKCVRKTRSRNGRTLHVNDSKLVYSPGSIAELERAVLTIAAASDMPAATLGELIGHVSPHVTADLLGYPWYAEAGESFPIDNDALDLRMRANALRVECERTSTRCLHMAARVLTEGEFNRMVGNTRNKSSVLFTLAAMHLEQLLARYGDRGLVVFCDRQGGRSHYGPLLRLMFEDWALEVLDEAQSSRSDYRLSRNGHEVFITFAEKAEAQCMSVAVASMVSKYLREGLMRRFNAWWAREVPGIAPTAGYYNDGQRFLNEIDQRRRALGIGDARLVRCR